jgi:hypothetical protein
MIQTPKKKIIRVTPAVPRAILTASRCLRLTSVQAVMVRNVLRTKKGVSRKNSFK